MRELFWWPDAWNPKPRIVLSDTVWEALKKEAEVSRVERLERMIILIGSVDGNIFFAERIVGHGRCTALGFVSERTAAGCFTDPTITIRIDDIWKAIVDLLRKDEQALLGHTHFEDSFVVEPSNLDKESSRRQKIAEIVFGKTLPFYRFRAVACASKREIPVFHNGKKLNRMF